MIFPILAVVHFATPGASAPSERFQPTGGLVAEQSLADSASSGGRLADIAPSLEEFERKPVLGGGMGTRITVGENANARLLDNQWLGLLIDSGLAGVLAFLWLVLRFARQQLALARASRGGYLPLACGSSVLAYAVGMFTYDSFSFTQVTFVFFMVLASGIAPLARRASARVRTAPSLRRASNSSSPHRAAPAGPVSGPGLPASGDVAVRTRRALVRKSAPRPTSIVG